MQEHEPDAEGAGAHRARRRVGRQRQAGGAEGDGGGSEAGVLGHIAGYDLHAVGLALIGEVYARDVDGWALAEVGLDDAVHDARHDVGRT